MLSRFRVSRTVEGRVMTGLAAGIGNSLGIDPAYVRAAFVVLSFAGGAGVVLYVLGWVLTLDRLEEEPESPTPTGLYQRAGVGLFFLGFLLLLREIGLWFGDEIVWPVTWVAFGLAFIWDRSDPPHRSRWARIAFPGYTEGPSVGRVLLGAVLLIGGVAYGFSRVGPLRELGSAMLTALIIGVGFVLIFGPWVWRLVRQLAQERRQRIRSEERAEMAAHLHDSVLQTLALLQRTDDPRQVATLARAQERELRSWLFGRAPTAGADMLGATLRAAAAKVETEHQVPVEVVTVGDRELDDRMRALVRAAREAMTNAARHSGASSVSLYAEINESGVEAWVSDQGSGFDAGAVAEDRRGISESIVGRMVRHGGTAEVISNQGSGTEVRLALGLEPT